MADDNYLKTTTMPETDRKCPNCGEYILAHRVCKKCGKYRGEDVIKVENED